jgi:hypothetical protein
MTDLGHRAGTVLTCHVIQRDGPQPIRACSDPLPPGSSGLGAGHGRRTADCRSVPAGLAGIHNHDPTTGSVRSP